ncbi:putative ribonuclease H-like domain-containing protein [Tanacetum coccineum]
MVPKAILMRSGLVSLTTARPVNTAQPRITVNSASPMTNVFNKTHSTVRRPINNKTTTKNSNFNQKVNTARPKAILNVVKGNQEKGVIDSGCSKHITENMSYLTDFEEIDGGYVAFGGNPKGGKITGMLTDESHVLLKVPRKNNMYSVDLKNSVSKGGLTCLFAKATSDESKLWHRRLGHINFKTMNTLVKGNLVRGSGPNWLFDIDALTKSINYKPVVAGNQSNGNAGTKACDDAGDDEKKVTEEPEKEGGDPSKEGECNDQEKEDNVNSTNNVNAASTNEVNVVDVKTSIELPLDPNMPELEDYSIFEDDEDVGAEAGMNNLNTTIQVSPILTTRIQKDHPLDQVIRDLQSALQTKRMLKNLEAHGFVSTI